MLPEIFFYTTSTILELFKCLAVQILQYINSIDLKRLFAMTFEYLSSAFSGFSEVFSHSSEPIVTNGASYESPQSQK